MKLPTLIFFLAVALVVPCLAADRERDPESHSPLGRLQALWKEDLSKRPEFKSREEALSRQIYENARIETRETTGAEAAQRIVRMLGATKRSLILSGEIEVLSTVKRVTEVYNPGTIRSGFAAYFDKEGKLVLFTIVPEG